MGNKVGYPALPYNNFGSLLQAYAIFHNVNKLGYECKIINYKDFVNRAKPTSSDYQLMESPESSGLNSKDLKTIENRILAYDFEQFCKKIFNYDEKLPALAGNASDYEKCKDYDAFICGSDQIFNPNGGWFKPVNYLMFAPKNKRIAYAASIGTNKISFLKQHNMPFWAYMLKQMTFISSRETTGAKILSVMSGKNVPVVIDPTILVSQKEWLELVKYGSMPKTVRQLVDSGKPYILAYLLHAYQKYKDVITEFAKKRKYEIVWIVGTDISPNYSINRVGMNPGGFIELVSKASYVCTDSFHGCCFSMIFRKQFVSPFLDFMNKSHSTYDVRKDDIFTRLGIPERIVTLDNFIEISNKEINYDEVYKIIDAWKEDSLNYLKNALETCTSSRVTEDMLPNRILPKNYDIVNPLKNKSVMTVKNSTCTGCGACKQTCPSNAIVMEIAQDGFLHPHIDPDKCTNCGICLRKCHAVQKLPLKREPSPFAYASWSLDPEIILNSSSGGLFSVIANWVFDRGGVVYGTGYGDDFLPEVKRITNKADLNLLRRSKYVESDVKNAFINIQKDLENNSYVLFSGTACQVAGLYAFLGKDYTNLVTIDVLCAGVPSRQVFANYLKFREKQANSSLSGVTFRTKNIGWISNIGLNFKNKKTGYSILEFEHFGFLFLKKFIVRPSCFECQYRNVTGRVADFTLGDFWGIERCPSFKQPRSQGVSLVLTNSVKGRIIFQNISSIPGLIYSQNMSMEEAIAGNPVLIHPSRKSIMYDRVMDSFLTKDFKDAFKEWFGTDEVREMSEKYQIPFKLLD